MKRTLFIPFLSRPGGFSVGFLSHASTEANARVSMQFLDLSAERLAERKTEASLWQAIADAHRRTL